MAPELEFAFGQPVTLEQWADMPEDDPGEVVNGRLVEEEAPSPVHELIVLWLGAGLRAWVVPRGGFVFGSEMRIAVAAGHGRKPDLSMYFPGRKPAAASLVRVPPDVMIEIVSPRPRDVRRDRVAKLDEYAAFGVHYYWILDPQARSLEIFERADDGRYIHALGAEEGVLERIPGCEGLRLSLDDLWAEVERLEPSPPEER
jgi:Uma2 family endonuclease